MNANSRKVIQYRIRIKQKLIQYKGGKCEKCGYNKPVPGAFHFHHRDPKEKSFNINASTLGFQRLKAEVDKCDLLCANCHAETHDEKWAESRVLAMTLGRKEKIPRDCKKCSNVFVPKRKEQIYCSRNCVPKF